jgi:SH3 domain protein
MRFSILLFSLFLFSALFSHQTVAQTTATEVASNSEQEDVRYISDELFIFMHAGPSRNFRILGSIYAGTKIAVLQVDEEAGFIKIRDERGRTGWVESDFVSPEPSIRVAHERVTKRLATQETSLNSLQTQLSQALKERNEAEQQKLALNKELSESRKKNAELTTHIEQKAQIDQSLWFTRGTVLALISVVLGFLLGLFARKRNKSNPLM